MKFTLQLLVCILVAKSSFSQIIPDVVNTALDLKLYRDVLNPDLCDRQLDLIENSLNLRILYLDAGARIPRGLLTGNLVDLGNYYQCLAIKEIVDDMLVEGKYSVIDVPLSQNFNLPNASAPNLPDLSEIPWLNNQSISDEILKGVEEYNLRRSSVLSLLAEELPRLLPDSQFTSLPLRLGVCIPKPCTPQVALDRLLFNFTKIGLKFDSDYYRLPNDKPWAPADYVFFAVLGVILILSILSTSYDVYHTVLLEKDPKTVSTIYRSFSAFSNTRRLVTYTPNPGNLECVDGIRAFAMMWVILGHTFSTQLAWFMANPLDAIRWMVSSNALWTTSSPITVDTFFTLSGLLVVYTTAGKLTGWKLLKNLHMFYINRFVRMFPILATGILLQASLFNWVADGPYWERMVTSVQRCRANWWSTLLYAQNYVHPQTLCLGHSWYLAVDMQCYVICPIVLFWVLNGKKTQAWISLVAAVMLALVSSSVYIFQMNFRSSIVGMSPEPNDYFSKYYFNTLTRGSPFFVGMLWGYLLHTCRGKSVKIGMLYNLLIWSVATVIGALIIYSHYPVLAEDWDNQFVDNLINSFMRPVWAMIIGWMIFACASGHGGPINWILSLRVWKVPSRLSYAMYILHYPLIFIVASTAISPTYFSIQFSLFAFIGHFFLSMFVAFLATVLIDAPISILIKLALGGGPKKIHPKKIDAEMNEETKEPVNQNIRL